MAIAFNTTTNGWYSANGTSFTFSHTCSWSDRILFVWFFHWLNTDNVTGVTYAWTSMTLINKRQVWAGQWIYLYYLIAPATWTNNVVCSASVDNDWWGWAVSYTWVLQTWQPDASVSNGTTATSIATSITTIANNCWVVWMWRTMDADWGFTSLSPWVFRQNAIVGYYALWDSDGTVSTWSNTYTATNNVSSALWCILASFSPSWVVANNWSWFLSFFLS